MITNKCATPPSDPGTFNGTWIWLEQNDGQLSRISFEMAGMGRKLSDKSGEKLVGLYLAGENGEEMARTSIEYGVDKVILVKNPVLSHYRTRPYSEIPSLH